MANIVLSTPKLGFIVATRAALAFGAALLVSKRLGARRRAVGQGLVALGVDVDAVHERPIDRASMTF